MVSQCGNTYFDRLDLSLQSKSESIHSFLDFKIIDQESDDSKTFFTRKNPFFVISRMIFFCFVVGYWLLISFQTFFLIFLLTWTRMISPGLPYIIYTIKSGLSAVPPWKLSQVIIDLFHQQDLGFQLQKTPRVSYPFWTSSWWRSWPWSDANLASETGSHTLCRPWQTNNIMLTDA